MSEIAEAAFPTRSPSRRARSGSSASTATPTSVTHDLEILRVSHEVEVEQVRVLAERRARRDDDGRARRGRRAWSTSRAPTSNMIEPMLDAVRVEATLGEICDALRAEWGEYREPARF